MITHYNKEKAKSLISKVLIQEFGDVINKDTIKVWSTPRMNISDVLNGIRYVKSIGESKVIFTNTVPLKSKLASENDIKIYDVDDLLALSAKHREYDLYDML